MVMMRSISNRVNIVFYDNLYKGFPLFRMGIIIADVVRCTILGHEVFNILSPLTLWFYSIDSSKDHFLSA